MAFIWGMALVGAVFFIGAKPDRYYAFILVPGLLLILVGMVVGFIEHG